MEIAGGAIMAESILTEELDVMQYFLAIIAIPSL